MHKSKLFIQRLTRAIFPSGPWLRTRFEREEVIERERIRKPILEALKPALDALQVKSDAFAAEGRSSEAAKTFLEFIFTSHALKGETKTAPKKTSAPRAMLIKAIAVYRN